MHVHSCMRYNNKQLQLLELYFLKIMYGHIYSKSMDEPGKVANPARGQLNRENDYFPVRVRA